MLPLPCPETAYLGPDRKPGTFLERLNTQEFTHLLDVMAEEVQEIIELRGHPACIIGVNSSPTCGVTSTYYGSEGTAPPKRAGRGMFLKRFPHIRALDVAEFAKYRVYLAAPLFSEAERDYNERIAELLRNIFFDVYLPQDVGDDTSSRTLAQHKRIYTKNIESLSSVDIVVAIIEGADADSGTVWEMGYAKALGKPVIALRTDFRNAGQHERVNLMLEQSSVVVGSKEDLLQLLESWGNDTGKEKHQNKETT
jgi:nucleoside 2-deoxyribosyltransferase